MKDIVLTAMKLNSDALQRWAHSARCSGQLAMSPPSAGRVQEAIELTTAAVKDSQAMQKRWMDSWMAWADYAGSLEGADTLPKFTERLGNIGLRAQAQVATQISETSDMMERLSVNYAYWVAQQVAPKD